MNCVKTKTKTQNRTNEIMSIESTISKRKDFPCERKNFKVKSNIVYKN